MSDTPCEQCHRKVPEPDSHRECSMADCPHRKRLTAAWGRSIMMHRVKLQEEDREEE